MTTKIFNCIHGLYWASCALCFEKAESTVKAEVKLAEETSDKKEKAYVEQVKEINKSEQDRAYDIEID